VLGHAHATVLNVEDLTAPAARGPCSPERLAAAPAGGRRMGNDSVRLSNLPERAARVTESAAGLHPGLLPEAAGALYFLPGRVERGR
jgi:hypothetical protein